MLARPTSGQRPAAERAGLDNARTCLRTAWRKVQGRRVIRPRHQPAAEGRGGLERFCPRRQQTRPELRHIL